MARTVEAISASPGAAFGTFGKEFTARRFPVGELAEVSIITEKIDIVTVGTQPPFGKRESVLVTGLPDQRQKGPFGRSLEQGNARFLHGGGTGIHGDA